MDHCRDQRQEKYGQNLLLDRPFYLPVAQSDLLHDLEPVVVVVPFCDLLVVDDQHGRGQEYSDKKDPDKEQASVNLIETVLLIAFCAGIAKCAVFF